MILYGIRNGNCEIVAIDEHGSMWVGEDGAQVTCDRD